MPLHDWSRVDAGIFHSFHLTWISTFNQVLNSGLLPSEYYALAEQRIPEREADVLTLRTNGNGSHSGYVPPTDDGGTKLLAPPKTKPIAISDIEHYRRKQNRLAIRHASDDRLVAVIEIVSPGNKSSKEAIREFTDKAIEFFLKKIHLVVLDPHRPTKRDLSGIHGAIWEQVSDDAYAGPADKPFTAASYESGHVVRAFVERLAIGDPWPETPLFLMPDAQIPLPVEETYQQTWDGFPRRWREVLEAPSSK